MNFELPIGTHPRPKMKLLSFYLDCSQLDSLDAIGKLVRQKRPEFIAFQNVTNDSIKKIKATPWCVKYNVIQPPFVYETRKKPTVVLFSTYPADDSRTVNYHETKSNKVLEKGYYVMHDKANKPFVIIVATTSLEKDLKESELRERQLNEACLSMAMAEDAFMIGDFNIDNDVDGELVFKGGWKDAWLSISGNTEANGCTYDPEKNPLIKADPFGPGRPDRLFFKSRNFQLDNVEVVGKVTPEAGAISKHYGLLAHFTQLDRPNPKEESPLVAVYFKRTEWSVQFQESTDPQDNNNSQEKADP
jgi:hypothetical protein